VTELRHGYTLADLHGIARLAVHAAGRMAGDWYDRYDVAWSAIAEALYSAEHWPPGHDLVHAGKLAVWATVDDDRRHHGYYRRKSIGGQAGPGSSPAFATWWDVFARPVTSPEHRVVERLALAQIWPTLTPGQRRALSALATFGDYQAAAAALGLSRTAFVSAVSAGRRRFLAAWHEGEVPSRPWGCDRRAGRTAGTARAGGTAVASMRRRRRSAALAGAS
jgi:hypothetical protein